jgi:hypothetical protein
LELEYSLDTWNECLPSSNDFTPKEYEGTGIGLAIFQEIVNQKEEKLGKIRTGKRFNILFYNYKQI